MTVPGRAGGVEHGVRRGAVGQRDQQRAVAGRARSARPRARRRASRRRGALDDAPAPCARRRAAQLLDRPAATSRPSLTIATASQRRSTSSSWWLENTTGTPVAAYSRQHAAEHVDADRVEAGERLVEHEQLRVVHERGGELHALLVAERERLDAVAGALARARAARSSGRGGRGGGRVRRRAAARGRRAGRARASSGTGRAPPACSRSASASPASTGRAAPAHLAAVGREHAEHDPHRGRLAGAVGPDEAEQLAGLDGERDAVERDDVAVAAREIGQLEHPRRSTDPPGGASTGTRTLSPCARPGRMRCMPRGEPELEPVVETAPLAAETAPVALEPATAAPVADPLRRARAGGPGRDARRARALERRRAAAVRAPAPAHGGQRGGLPLAGHRARPLRGRARHGRRRRRTSRPRRPRALASARRLRRARRGPAAARARAAPRR